MKCPVCGNELAGAPGHEACFKKDPSRFAFLKRTDPAMYASLVQAIAPATKHEGPNSSGAQAVATRGTAQPPASKCTMVGKCNWATYHVHVSAADVSRWEREGRVGILRKVQIDPTSYAPGRLFAMDDIEQLKSAGTLDALLRTKYKTLMEGEDLSKPFAGMETFIKENEAYFDDLSDFVTSEHECIDDGDAFSGRSMLGISLPHWFIKGVYQRAIFVPKSFATIKEGMRRNLVYEVIVEMYNRCAFLDGRICQIHKTKPEDCEDS
jgi:Fe-S-cluster containining protein